MHTQDTTSGARNGAAIASGLEGICVTKTRLSRVDGQRGQLVIGGFPVEELAPHASFEDVLHLLWYSRLPSPEEADELQVTLARQRHLPEASLALLRAAAKRGVPHMDALRMAIASLTLADPHPTDQTREAQLRRAQAMVASFPTAVAAYARLRRGLEPVTPNAALSHAANYLHMLHGEPQHADRVRALETYLNTVVDHGMNASTFTARVIISTRSDMVSALSGAIGALKGPLHGGAPGPALDMVFEIRDRAARSGRTLAEEAEAWVQETLTSGGRIMGFGHRVYKVRDPRAEVLGVAAARLFEKAGDRSLYDVVRTVEQVVVRVLHEHKPDRRLETNVEFYTALLLHGIGLDSDLFTPTFAIARAGGWTAHVLEQVDEDRLIRPDSLYVGDEGRHWEAA